MYESVFFISSIKSLFKYLLIIGSIGVSEQFVNSHDYFISVLFVSGFPCALFSSFSRLMDLRLENL